MALLIFALSLGFYAESAQLVRQPGNLHGASTEYTVRLREARLVRVHMERLRRDFPELMHVSDAEIERQLLACVGYISIPQSHANNVNTPVPIDKNSPSRLAWRPLAYGRGLVFTCFGGLIDAKGAGLREIPQPGEYTSGVFALARALREDLIAEVVGMILAREGYDPGVVEVYGEVDLGFDINGEGRAGMLLRQAHRRGQRPDGFSGKNGEVVEALLRKYGIASHPQHVLLDWHTMDRHNIQLDATGSMFDFETVRAVSEFKHSPVNPDPDLRLDPSLWSEENLQAWSQELARLWAGGEITRAEVDAEFERWLGPLRARLASTSPICAANLTD